MMFCHNKIMNKEMKNKSTINGLAIMVAKGFENTATKDD